MEHDASPDDGMPPHEEITANSAEEVELELVDKSALHERKAAAFECCQHLLTDPLLYSRIQNAITEQGYAGDTWPVEVLYIAAISRLLPKPVNVAVVAQAASGKNAALDAALGLIPPEDVFWMSAGSARALIFTPEEFKHRIVAVKEADSIPDDGPAASAIRALAEDNVLRYAITEKRTDGKFETRVIVKEGPTCLLTTSTRSVAHQLGTRVLELGLREDREQTRLVLQAQAAQYMGALPEAPNIDSFLAMQKYLTYVAPVGVVIPYALRLSDLVSAEHVRARRDFPQLCSFIAATALLHCEQRRRDSHGRIVASIDDYVIARRLLTPTFDAVAADGINPALRDTISAVEVGALPVSVTELARRTGTSKQTVANRVKKALDLGYLEDLNGRQGSGQAMKLVRTSDPLPELVGALPDPSLLIDETLDVDEPNVPAQALPSRDKSNCLSHFGKQAMTTHQIEELIANGGLAPDVAAPEHVGQTTVWECDCGDSCECGEWLGVPVLRWFCPECELETSLKSA